MNENNNSKEKEDLGLDYTLNLPEPDSTIPEYINEFEPEDLPLDAERKYHSYFGEDYWYSPTEGWFNHEGTPIESPQMAEMEWNFDEF